MPIFLRSSTQTATVNKEQEVPYLLTSSRLQWASILVVLLSLSCSSLLPQKLTITVVADLFKVLSKDLRSVSQAKAITPVISKPFTRPWPEPKSPEELFGNSTRILWGYWDTYPDGMPELVQKALLSWQLRNPDWKVIILSDSNVQKYVSASDLPTTFFSLKVQHRSDIIRLAVLIRYGGIYMDASTLVYKSFDEIWNTVEDDKLLLTSLNQLPGAGLDLYNNGLLMTKGTNNPFLIEWRRRIVQYHEAPALTIEEMEQHPAFQRVVQHWDDPTLGLLGTMIPYHSNLWILSDMIWHNDSGLSDYVIHLPKLRWGFYCHVLPYLFDQLKLMSPQQFAKQNPATIDPKFVQWNALGIIGYAAKHLLKGFTEDIPMANGVMDNIHTIKFTSHSMDLVDFYLTRMGLNNTIGRLYRGAYSTEEFPTQQATLFGAVPPATSKKIY